MCNSISKAMSLEAAWKARGYNLKKGGRKGQVTSRALTGEQFGHKAGSLVKW